MKIDLSNTNWQELRKQKETILKAVDCFAGEDEENASIINELDAVGIFSDTGTVIIQGDKLVLTDTAIKTTIKGLHY